MRSETEPPLKKRLLPLVLFLILATTAWAQTSSQIVEFAGTTFRPQVYEIDGRNYFKADDPEVLGIVNRSNVTAQWSSSGQTLFAFAPGRESYWTAGSDQAKINGKEQKAPGRILVDDGNQYIEPAALFYALATKGVPTPNGYALYPVITEIVRHDDGFLLRAAHRTRAKTAMDGQTTVFSAAGFAWDGPREMTIGETHFSFDSSDGAVPTLEVRITPQPFHIAKLAGSTLLNETRVSVQPNFPGADRASEVTLKSLNASNYDGQPMLVFEFDAGTKMHYVKDSKNGLLRILIPRGLYPDTALSDKDWPGLSVSTLQTSLYPVLELSLPLGNGALEFVTLENSPTSLALVRGSQGGEGHPIADSGSVETPGWLNIRGTIVIDPGHGGSDPGCVNRALGTREADVTLAISLHLAEVLRAQGWNVVLTRESDRDVTYAGSPDMLELQTRADIANNINADLFMSIHCNASVNSGAQGTSIHWWKAEDYEFAQALEHVLGTSIGLGQKGLIRDRFVVLRHSKMPSVLVETAFLSNPYEGAKLSDPAFQKVIAQQLAGGLASYMQGRYASRGAGRAVD